MPDLNSHIQAHKAELHALCREYGVERLELFGRDVELVTERSTSNFYVREAVDSTRDVVYDPRREEPAA